MTDQNSGGGMRVHGALVVVAAAALLSACGGEGGGEWAGTVRDSAGVTLVENPVEGVWSEDERPTVEEELRIGSAEGGSAGFGSQITGLAVADDGTIYVLDQQAQLVRVFSAGGDFLRTIGGPGSGPGELGQALAGVFLVGDTLFVPDMMNQRVNVYPAAGQGEPLSFPLDIRAGIPMKWEALPDGRLATQVREGAVPGSTGGMSDRILVRAPTGEVVDTLLELPTGQSFDFTGGMPRMRIFAAEPTWSVGPDGTVVYADNSQYRIHVADAEGNLQRIVSRAVEPQPVTEADQNALLRLIREQIAAQGIPAEAMEPMLSAMQFAENYPTMATVLAGPGGMVWAQRIRTARDFEEAGVEFDPNRIGSPVWDVFDGEGRYLGTVEVPEGFQAHGWKNDRLYGVLRDDLDVLYVVRLRVDGLPATPVPLEGVAAR
ncbi:MAG: 6-bladed beta-propeller [Gemmatimonadota bacterium]